MVNRLQSIRREGVRRTKVDQRGSHKLKEGRSAKTLLGERASLSQTSERVRRTETTESEANPDQSLVNRAVNGGECPFYNLSFTSFPRSSADCRFAKTLQCLKEGRRNAG